MQHTTISDSCLSRIQSEHENGAESRSTLHDIAEHENLRLATRRIAAKRLISRRESNSSACKIHRDLFISATAPLTTCGFYGHFEQIESWKSVCFHPGRRRNEIPICMASRSARRSHSAVVCDQPHALNRRDERRAGPDAVKRMQTDGNRR